MNKAATLVFAIFLSFTGISCNSGPEKLNSADYEILAVKHSKAAENYFLFYKGDRAEDKLNAFAQSFKAKNCKGNCNIYIFDTDEVMPYLTKGNYDLQGKDRVKYADHLIGQLSFDSKTVRMYPQKDAK